MLSRTITLSLTCICLLVFAGVAAAKMSQQTGLVSHSSIPKPIISKSVVVLDVPHIRQKRDHCVPTSAAMILRYYGETHDPALLKRYAEEHKPKSKRNTTFTYWVDMRRALKVIGKNWTIRDYPKTERGYQRGLNDIKRSLRAKRPVMIDVHLGPGHTFVIMGFNDEKQVVYIRDPDLPKSRSRILPYSELRRSWHNHRFGNSRSAFFSR